MWIDTAACPQVPRGSFRFGNAGRNIIDGPCQINFNAALLRNSRIRERVSIQF